ARAQRPRGGDGLQRLVPRRRQRALRGGARRRGARRCRPRADGPVAAVQLRPRGARAAVSKELLRHEVTLLELVDRVLNKGVVLSGDITLSVADADLVYVGLRVLLSSVATLEQQQLAREASA